MLRNRCRLAKGNCREIAQQKNRSRKENKVASPKAKSKAVVGKNAKAKAKTKAIAKAKEKVVPEALPADKPGLEMTAHCIKSRAYKRALKRTKDAGVDEKAQLFATSAAHAQASQYCIVQRIA